MEGHRLICDGGSLATGADSWQTAFRERGAGLQQDLLLRDFGSAARRHEKKMGQSAAWSAPGFTSVEDQIKIAP